MAKLSNLSFKKSIFATQKTKIAKIKKTFAPPNIKPPIRSKKPSPVNLINLEKKLPTNKQTIQKIINKAKNPANPAKL